MKLALQDETELNLMEPELAVGDEIFSDQDLEKEEPLLYDLQHIFGIDAVELEDEMPALKMENQMNPKDYKVWKNLPVAEKSRLLRQIRSTAEYKEFIQACAMLAATKGYEAVKKHKAGSKTESGNGKNVSSGGKETAENMSAKIASIEDKEAGSKVSSKEAKEIVEKSGKQAVRKAVMVASETIWIVKGVNQAAVGAGGENESAILSNAKEKSLFVVRLGAVVMAQLGVPFLLVALIAAIILSIISAVVCIPQQYSKNAGIMPYYAQADYATTPFNGGTIKSDGCGITSMAMVVSLFKNDTITPNVLADMANKDASFNTVNSHKAINKFAEYYELGAVEEMAGPNKNCCRKTKYDLEYIKKKIQEGSPVIVSVTGGYYNPAGGGHYIALYGAGSNGVFVYDPGSRAKYQATIDSDGGAWGVVFEEAKHIWIFPAYSSTYLTGGTNEESVWLNLKQAGFSDAAAAGVIGNMYQESSHGAPDLRPSAESKDGSVGLLQWTKGRREALESLGRNRNTDWKDLSVQIEYLLQESNSGAQWKWTSYAKSKYDPSDNISFEEFKQLQDPQKAAEVFQAKFVRPNYEKSNLSYRKQMAQKVFEKYTNEGK